MLRLSQRQKKLSFAKLDALESGDLIVNNPKTKRSFVNVHKELVGRVWTGDGRPNIRVLAYLRKEVADSSLESSYDSPSDDSSNESSDDSSGGYSNNFSDGTFY